MKKKFVIPIGELIDRISILNVKIWHTEEALSKANEDGHPAKVGDIALMIRALNTERANLREEINIRLDKKLSGTKKINYVNVGRGK